MNKTVIKNADIFGEITDIVMENGQFSFVGKTEYDGLDIAGKRVIPGLIDTHIHGFAGKDASDGDLEFIATALAKAGTTAWLPTTMTASDGELSRITSEEINLQGAEIIGFHLEGPYISEKKCGAQNKADIRKPDINEFSHYKNVVKVTVAPEAEGIKEFIENAGCHISLGHTACTFDEATAAFTAGADCLTHTFNAMPPFLHREPGPIGAALMNGAFAEVIADGRHVSPAVVLALYKMFGDDKMILISDCIRPAGMPDGEYSSGGIPVIAKGGMLTLRDGTLAGGSNTLLQNVFKATEMGIPFKSAVKMASETPAAYLGIKKGKIEKGYDADLLVLNDDNAPEKVFIKGKLQ